jgi:hypothetical protein
MLKYDGTVDYYLDPNDYTKKEDGTASDIADDTYGGNAMMEWGQNGKKIWYMIVPDADPTSASVYISDTQVNEDYKAWSFINNQGELVDHFYTSIYEGWIDGENRLRSISGKSPVRNTSLANHIIYAKNNNSDLWNISVYADYVLIAILTTLIIKSLSGTDKIGNGNSKQSPYLSSGTQNNSGLFFGYNADYKKSVKVFGMENYWGNLYKYILGSTVGGGNMFYKLTKGTQDGSTGNDYTLNDYKWGYGGYLSINMPAFGSSGYVKKHIFTKYASTCSATGGTISTYYQYRKTDYPNDNFVRYAHTSLEGTDGTSRRGTQWALEYGGSSESPYFTSRLSCKPQAPTNI